MIIMKTKKGDRNKSQFFSRIFYLIVSLFITSSVYAIPINSRCDSNTILACYLARPEIIARPWVFEKEEYNTNLHVLVQTYTLTSQHWPLPNVNNDNTLWKHTLVIYQPDVVQTEQALLFINGGTRNPILNDTNNLNNPFPSTLNFARIASTTHSVVADLQDVPNQYLTLDDGISRKEDGLVAYTWSRYLADPNKNAYLPLHLPMTKAVIKAMDAIQKILWQKNAIKVSYFVVAGASKRGWAAWLAGISDERVNAIVPIVINIFNMKANLKHTYESYGNTWPPAFFDYINEKIPERLDSPEFKKLIAIEDIISYLNCDHCDFYKKRLHIPKYIISASGDDFFVPDSLNMYFNQLPGEKIIRVVPNQPHYIDMKIVENTLLPYYQMIIRHIVRPKIKWKVDANNKLLSVTTHQAATSVVLWEAENPHAQDFRLAAHITYYSTPLLIKHCGKNRKNDCRYPVVITAPVQGWKASFIEVQFARLHQEPLILTTPVYITKAR